MALSILSTSFASKSSLRDNLSTSSSKLVRTSGNHRTGHYETAHPVHLVELPEILDFFSVTPSCFSSSQNPSLTLATAFLTHRYPYVKI